MDPPSVTGLDFFKIIFNKFSGGFHEKINTPAIQIKNNLNI